MWRGKRNLEREKLIQGGKRELIDVSLVQRHLAWDQYETYMCTGRNRSGGDLASGRDREQRKLATSGDCNSVTPKVRLVHSDLVQDTAINKISAKMRIIVSATALKRNASSISVTVLLGLQLEKASPL